MGFQLDDSEAELTFTGHLTTPNFPKKDESPRGAIPASLFFLTKQSSDIQISSSELFSRGKNCQVLFFNV